jgi:ribosomal protein S18 acetylase RimI-like enzyme
MSSELTTWTIRRATPDDIPALIAMQREGWTSDYVGFMPDGYGEMAMQRYGVPETIRQHITAYAYYFVAERNGTVIGTICGDNLNETEAEIWWIHVPIAYRGEGIGRALIAYFCAQLAPKIDWLYVTTFDGYTPTVTFYERVGFVAHERMIQHYDGVPVNDLRLRMPARNTA